MTDKTAKTDTEWKTLLSPEQYEIARRKGTERAFTGALWNNKAPGTYACICCGTALFHSADKYDSGSGWPSFTRPTAAQSVGTNVDRSHGMERVEVVCARCDAHLGHVFPDGPAPTGLRYCINSASLRFDKA